jgi:hypothetical protein
LHWQQSILNINSHGINMLQSWKGLCEIGPALTYMVIYGWPWADMAMQISITLLEQTQSTRLCQAYVHLCMTCNHQTICLAREMGEGTDTLEEDQEDQEDQHPLSKDHCATGADDIQEDFPYVQEMIHALKFCPQHKKHPSELASLKLLGSTTKQHNVFIYNN